MSGSMEAGDRGEALRQLDRKGLQPVSIVMDAAVAAAPAKNKKGAAAPAVEKTAKKVDEEVIPDGPIKLKRAEIVLFTEELSDMLAAGLQLEPALRAMEGRQELGNLKVVSSKIRQFVRDGNSFSASLRRVSPSFGSLYCNLAAAGEASGALDTILERQAHYLKMLQELQGRVVLALIYPCFLVLAGIGVGIIFITQLIPQLTGLIESGGGKIPLGAKLLMGASNFFTKWWLVIVLVIVAALILFKAWKDNDANKPTWDRIQLKIPLFGRVIEHRFYVQFLETMANLVGNGLPLLRALELTKDATPNLYLQAHLTEMLEWVGDGRSLSASLSRSGAFSPLLIDMVSVGEQTGKIDQSLRKAASRFDKELNNSLQAIMALIMPAVLLLMAGLIGSMAYLMITAIFQTIESIGTR
ncbi:type II secretion system F family protein [bacterium]|nr:type II secretion system F family protein [bacterium]